MVFVEHVYVIIVFILALLFINTYRNVVFLRIHADLFICYICSLFSVFFSFLVICC